MGEAFSKNAAGGGIGLGAGGISYGLVHGGFLGISTPVGLTVIEGIAVSLL